MQQQQTTYVWVFVRSVFAIRKTVTKFVFRNALLSSVAGTHFPSSGTLACRNEPQPRLYIKLNIKIIN